MPTPREMMEAAKREQLTGRDERRRPIGDGSVYNDERPRADEREARQQSDQRRARRPIRAANDAQTQDVQRESQRERDRVQQRRVASNSDEPSVREPGARPSQRYVRRFITRWRMMGVTAFAVIMAVGCLVGLLFFARPTTSAVEMRTLTAFPEFTVQSFLNGSYFTQVSLWYADTYPLREPMVAADHALQSLYGVNTGTGMVGGNVKADEIPVESSEEAPKPVKVEPLAEAPDERVVAADIQANIMSGVYVQDGSGYAIYYFSQSAADTYIAAMNKAAEALDGVSTVYSILAPMNSITLGDEMAESLGGSDQQQTLDYLRTRFDSRVKSIEVVDDIKAHRDEYLYFHTDHHWTQLGAYYAYAAFCEEKGIEPKKPSSKREVNLGELVGTYYETIESMGYVQRDEVIAYIPNGTNDMTYWTADGEEIPSKVVDEEAVNWDPSFKYSAFIAGDRPLEIIHNDKVTDGSSCLVVKDSYGCAFVPNLVDNYETIHVIDFRETDKNLVEYAKENKIQDVIFMTAFKIGLTDTVAQTLLSEVS